MRRVILFLALIAIFGLAMCDDERARRGSGKASNDPEQCPTGWVSHGGSCYYFQLSKIMLNFNTAVQQCTDRLKSHLVSIETSDEFNFLKEYLNDIHSSISHNIKNDFLISGEKVYGVWKWTNTGAVIDFSQLQWGSYEPDGSRVRVQDCLSLTKHDWLTEGYKLFDTDCGSYERQFVCEI